MRVIADFFRLIRSGNLLMVAITQLFAYYFLTRHVYWYYLFDFDFLALMFCTILVAAGGYIINDYMDVKLDLVNKPGKVIIGNSISRRSAIKLHLVINFVALFFAYAIGKKVFLLVLVSAAMLWLYSQFLKKTYLAGNVLVGLLTAFTLLILLVFDGEVNQNAIWIFALFAFVATLIREIIKDTEDMRGDAKFKAKTLPIVLGVRKTKNILLGLQLTLIIIVFVYLTLFGAISNSSGRIAFLCIIYNLFIVVVPAIVNLWLLKTADVKADFTRLSLLSKINMLAGIIGMVFWKF